MRREESGGGAPGGGEMKSLSFPRARAGGAPSRLGLLPPGLRSGWGAVLKRGDRPRQARPPLFFSRRHGFS